MNGPGGWLRAATIAAALALLLVACLPAVPARTVVLDPTRDAPLPVAAGETLELVATFEYSEFELMPGDLDRLELLPRALEGERRAVSGAFTLRSAGIPEGWGLELIRVERVRLPLGDEATPGRGGAAGDLVRLEAHLRLAVPEGAAPGVEPLRIVLRARNGVEAARLPRVEVGAPATSAMR